MSTLYLVGTPIGNLEDITYRAVRVLKEVSLIAAEDTRRARILARRYAIETPITSYFEGNEQAKLGSLLAALDAGDVALISEAGMPALSDPGYDLARAAVARGHTVTAVPGPSAPIVALVLSGLPTDRFLYLGFLPRRAPERRALLSAVADEPYTLICFEAPHRLRRSLADMAARLGDDRPIAICRELTKLHEEVWRGTVREAQAHFEAVEPRGEFTLVIGGAPAEARWSAERVAAEMERLRAQGVARSTAARQVAAASGWKRSEVYSLGLPDERD